MKNSYRFVPVLLVILSVLNVNSVLSFNNNGQKERKIVAEDQFLKECFLPSFDPQKINSPHLKILYDNLTSHRQNLNKISAGWYGTERLHQIWDGSDWVNSTRYLYQYDGALRNYIYINQDWQNSAWENDYRYEYIYDTDGKRTGYYYYVWENGNWVYYTKAEIIYLPNGYTSMYLYYHWENNNWVYLNRYNYIYDTTNKLTEVFVELYNNGVWENSYKGLYYYDNQGYQSEYISQNWYGGAWLNSGRSTYGYNTNGYLAEYIWQSWVDNNWLNYNKTEYSYNAQNYLTQSVMYLWVPPAGWTNSTKSTHTYDQSNKTNIILTEAWSLLTSSWENSIQIQYFYNANGYTEKELYRNWGNGFWVYSSQILHTYAELTDVETADVLPTEYHLYQNYPNPFNPETTIRYDLPEAAFVTLKIYDALGREVTTLVNDFIPPGKHSVNFNAVARHSAGVSLPSGVYFYRITAGEFSLIKKLVLIK